MTHIMYIATTHDYCEKYWHIFIIAMHAGIIIPWPIQYLLNTYLPSPVPPFVGVAVAPIFHSLL